MNPTLSNASTTLKNEAAPAAPGTVVPDAARLIAMLLTGLLAASIGMGLSSFIGLVPATVAGLVLGWAFSRFTHRALGHDGPLPWHARIGFGVVALMLGLISIGLNASALYARLAAESSVVEDFALRRQAAQQRVENVLGNAKSASMALNSWSAHSTRMASQETDSGGSCPLVASNRTFGDIARFRQNEGLMARDLALRMDAMVQAASAAYAKAHDMSTARFDDISAYTQTMNASVEGVNSLRSGAGVEGVLQSLRNQLGRQIQRPNGDVAACGDAHRDESIRQAISALERLTKAEAISTLTPSLNIRDREAVTLLALQRSPHIMACFLSGSLYCRFGDDPMLERAFAAHGVYNNESLPTFLAALLEMLLVVTTAIRRPGAAPFEMDPSKAIERAEAKAVNPADKSWKLALRAPMLAAAKLATNLGWVRTPPQAAAAPGRRFTRTPAEPGTGITELHLRLAEQLQPFLTQVAGVDYALVPDDHASALKGVVAGHALAYEGCADIVSDIAGWQDVARHPALARHAVQIARAPREARYSVFELDPGLAYALRLRSLALHGAAAPAT